MTEAYAIKDSTGKIIDVGMDEADLKRQWHPSYPCDPVTVSEFEEPLSPELAKKYPLDRRLRIFIEQLMLADDVAKEFDYEEAKRLHRELVDRLTAVSEKGEAEALVVDIADLLKAGSSIEPTSTMHKRIDAYFSRRQG